MYPGWHDCSVRGKSFPGSFSEWDLVLNAPKRFDNHYQPRIPARGIYDDSDPEVAANQVKLATAHGVDMFVYGFFWSRGKRALYKPLDEGFLKSKECDEFLFAVMWANRMPRGVLPVKNAPGPEIDPGRLVYTDRDDFMNLIIFLEENYFRRRNYFRINNKPLFSIFDSTFFINQLGFDLTSEALNEADKYLISKGYDGLHLMGLNPAPKTLRHYNEIGFQSLSHYVWLPDWKGDHLQDYQTVSTKRAKEWAGFANAGKLPYYPSVSPGWDATPRGEIHGNPKTQKYPWWPVVVGENPELFRGFLEKGINFTVKHNDNPIVFIASWNEWSEGHYLEPDQRYGEAWLHAVKEAKGNVGF